MRIDGRINDSVNTFGRYSLGNFFRDGPTAFGTGGGQELVSLGGVSDVKNQSLAYGVDYAFSSIDARGLPVRLLQVQGQRPAVRLRHDAGGRRGHSRPQRRQDVQFRAAGADSSAGIGGFNFGSGLGVNRCNCPLDQDEKQWQLVGNLTKTAGNHNFKVGLDIRRANNLRVPSDAHRSGELSFTGIVPAARRAAALASRHSCWATSRSFDATSARIPTRASSSGGTFYYAQDTWRADRAS